MPFTKDEYKERLKKTKQSMQEKGIELLISQDTNNMNYLTGYDAWSFYYSQCVIVHIDYDEPLCFIRAQDAGGAYIKTYLKNENIIVYDEKYIHTWPTHPYDALINFIKERKWEKSNIGVEMDSHYFTAFCYEKLKQGLPNANIKDSKRLVNWVRLIKSDAEIIIHGHTHRPMVHDVEIGKRKHKRVVLGDWGSKSHVLILSKKILELQEIQLK